MEPASTLPLLLLVPLLLATNACFVAAEFALIAVRRHGFEQAAREGDAGAKRTLRLLDRSDALSTLAQLGASVSTITLGVVLTLLILEWTAALGPRSIPAALVAGVLVAALLHVAIGAQVPKAVAVRHVERFVGSALPLLALLETLLRPLTWLAGAVASVLVRPFGLRSIGYQKLVHTPEEIRILVDEGHQHGVVEEDEREMVYGVFEFSDTVAREVMTPRTDVVAVPLDVTLEQLIDTVVSEGHSRLPVYDSTIDSVVGVFLAKDLLPLLRDSGTGESFSIARVMREPYFVPDTKPVDDLLAEFRQQSIHLAIVLDEFGGTYGLVTMEDLLEEIVGEITDEFDVEDRPELYSTPEGDIVIDGGTSIATVNERFGLEIPEHDFDTVGGFVFGALGRVPDVGDRVTVSGDHDTVELVVESTEDRRVTDLRLVRSVSEDASAESP
jgi:putative hemolysin